MVSPSHVSLFVILRVLFIFNKYLLNVQLLTWAGPNVPGFVFVFGLCLFSSWRHCEPGWSLLHPAYERREKHPRLHAASRVGRPDWPTPWSHLAFATASPEIRCPQLWGWHFNWSSPPEPGLWHSTDVLRAPLPEHMGNPSTLLHRNAWFIHLLGGVDYTNNGVCHKFQPCSCQYLFEIWCHIIKMIWTVTTKIYRD